jgi:hypothetical protein
MKNNRFVKTLGLVAVIGLMTGLQSCTKALQNLHFNLGMQTQTVTVTIPPTSGNVAIGPVEAVYNVDSFIKAQTGQQLGVSNISSVKIASVVLSLSNANATNSFGNFQSCTASFYSNTNATPYTMSIPSNPEGLQPTLSLPVDANTEMKSYIGDHFYYNVSGILRTPTTIPLTCTITVNYNLIVQG